MSSTVHVITTEEARESLPRAGFVLRSQPAPGVDPAEWRHTVEGVLDSSVVRRALEQGGVTRPVGGPEPTDDPAAFLASLDQLLDGAEHAPVPTTTFVVTVMAGIIAGYAAGHEAGAQLEPPLILDPGAST